MYSIWLVCYGYGYGYILGPSYVHGPSPVPPNYLAGSFGSACLPHGDTIHAVTHALAASNELEGTEVGVPLVTPCVCRCAACGLVLTAVVTQPTLATPAFRLLCRSLVQSGHHTGNQHAGTDIEKQLLGATRSRTIVIKQSASLRSLIKQKNVKEPRSEDGRSRSEDRAAADARFCFASYCIRSVECKCQVGTSHEHTHSTRTSLGSQSLALTSQSHARDPADTQPTRSARRPRGHLYRTFGVSYRERSRPKVCALSGSAICIVVCGCAFYPCNKAV